MRKGFGLWGVAVVGATGIVNCSIQDLPADSAGGGGAAAGKSGSAAQSGGAGVTGGRPGEGGAAGEAGAAGGEPTTSAGAGSSNGGTSGVSGGGGSVTGGAGAGGTGGASVCGNGAVDTQVSDANCGACGYACVNGRHCSAGRCTPAWQPLATENQPEPRTSHAAGYVDGKYVVFGGTNITGGEASSVAATYDVAANTWASAPPLNSARCGHSAVSTGSSIITFGGLTSCTNGATTGPGFEVFAGGSWTTVSGGPIGRYYFGTVWTGKEMFIYGGSNSVPALATGSRFDPSGPSWTDIACPLPNCERPGTDMFVDSGVVHIWGGGGYGDAPAGIQYDLTTGSWNKWTLPDNTLSHLSGEYADDGRRIYFLDGTNQVSIFDHKTLKWLDSDTSPTPAGFCGTAPPAWTGSELVAWSGSCGGAPVAVGGRYQPAAPN